MDSSNGDRGHPRLTRWGLSKSACDVIFGQLVQRVGEYHFGFAHFDQVSQVKVGRALGHPCGLLHLSLIHI